MCKFEICSNSKICAKVEIYSKLEFSILKKYINKYKKEKLKTTGKPTGN
jgi:hypothetical protein